MIQLILRDVKCLRLNQTEKVYAGENKISEFNVVLPEKITQYKTADCEIEMRSFVSEDRYISNQINTSTRNPKVPITSDLTEKAQTVPIMFFITHEGNVIGKTNFEKLNVLESKDGSTIDPREELDEIIAELRAENAAQAQTISSQATTIEQQSGRITELNGEVAELSADNELLRDTVETFNKSEPKLETPDIVTPSGETQLITPDTSKGYVGLKSVTVNRVTAEGVGFNPDYYKEGEECLGKVGTYNPFPEQSYGGIYYTELGEGGYPKKILIKDMLRSASAIPSFFNTSNDAKRELREVVFENCPEFLTIPTALFLGFNYLIKVILPNSLTSISSQAFANCTSLTELSLPNSLTSISPTAFMSCTSLTELSLPNSLTSISPSTLQYCTSLTNLTLAQGFNCNNLNVSWSTRYSVETLVAMLEALADRTGETAYTLTIGTTNINKLTAEQRSIATNKNWNLA